MALVAGVQRRRAGERRVDLLLPIRRVIVLGEVLEVRGKVLDLHAERAHAESGASAAEPSAVRRFELLDPLDRDVRHLVPSFLSQSSDRFALKTNGSRANRQASRPTWRSPPVSAYAGPVNANRSDRTRSHAERLASRDGYFAPESVIRRVGNTPVTPFLGGGTAVLLQVAHPLVAAGVAAHSTYDRDIWRRLVGTLRALYLITYGSKAEAERAADAVKAAHTRVKGVTDTRLGVFPAGTAYSAGPRLMLWVHATLRVRLPRLLPALRARALGRQPGALLPRHGGRSASSSARPPASSRRRSPTCAPTSRLRSAARRSA